MIMKKNYLLVMALAAMVSCSSDEFVGDSGSPNVVNGNGGEKAIAFASSTPSITRSEGATAAAELGYTFAVYATKTVGSTTSNVFAHNTYSETSNTPYWVWYNTSTANTTTSNTHDWEYVGAAGDKTTPGGAYNLANAQEIKFWDYSADNYVFTAYKNKSGGTVSNVTTNGFTFAGDAAALAGLYVADKLTITAKASPAAHTTADNKIGDAVKFTFRSAAAKVRLGIYETIPGYVVQNVKFRPTEAQFTETTANATLCGSFNGTSSTSSGTYTVSYNSSTGVAEFDNTSSPSTYFNFGTFASATPTALGTTSTSPMWATGSSDYQSVLPNTDNVDNMILYVDYDLYNSASGETIHVKGAKAVVPQAYMTWNPNYAYTYLFKISDNTNGYTGESTLPSGLWPISFDAVTVAATDGSQMGIITTVSTPSITTYQTGSVVDTSEPAAHGIKYVTGKAIYLTVQDNTTGALNTLANGGDAVGAVQVIKLAAAKTEADLQIAAPTGTNMFTLGSTAITVDNISYETNKYGSFTPTEAGYYAIQYLTTASGSNPAVYTYKVVYVESAS